TPSRALPHPLSFPTRRSSDLARAHRLPSLGRHDQAEAATLAVAALEVDARADQAGELLRDVQPQSRALIAPARFHLLESLEQLRSEEHTSELQSRFDLVCRLL